MCICLLLVRPDDPDFPFVCVHNRDEETDRPFSGCQIHDFDGTEILCSRDLRAGGMVTGLAPNTGNFAVLTNCRIRPDFREAGQNSSMSSEVLPALVVASGEDPPRKKMRTERSDAGEWRRASCSSTENHLQRHTLRNDQEQEGQQDDEEEHLKELNHYHNPYYAKSRGRLVQDLVVQNPDLPQATALLENGKSKSLLVDNGRRDARAAFAPCHACWGNIFGLEEQADGGHALKWLSNRGRCGIDAGVVPRDELLVFSNGPERVPDHYARSASHPKCDVLRQRIEENLNLWGQKRIGRGEENAVVEGCNVHTRGREILRDMLAREFSTSEEVFLQPGNNSAAAAPAEGASSNQKPTYSPLPHDIEQTLCQTICLDAPVPDMLAKLGVSFMTVSQTVYISDRREKAVFCYFRTRKSVRPASPSPAAGAGKDVDAVAVVEKSKDEKQENALQGSTSGSGGATPIPWEDGWEVHRIPWRAPGDEILGS
mmetsp:Transcript_13956/g.34490  ORF Transcript_13956/g.34490 Transcript_13956/m.34490 type:complete len:485 (+) Transcript_13956:358-1812(+)